MVQWQKMGVAPMTDGIPISRVVQRMRLNGFYTVTNDFVTVRTTFGSKTAELGNSKPSSLAFVMLRELYEFYRRLPLEKPDRRSRDR